MDPSYPEYRVGDVVEVECDIIRARGAIVGIKESSGRCWVRVNGVGGTYFDVLVAPESLSPVDVLDG